MTSARRKVELMVDEELNAVLMGFGAMLAGGCAVGAGLSGGSILSLTAWIAVASMWGGAIVTDRLLAIRQIKAMA